jgi:hypothetical protein
LVREAQPPHFFLLLLFAAIFSSCGGVVSGPALPVTVTVTPGSAQPFAGSSVQFSAAVQNAPSSGVNWMVNSVAGGNGTVGSIDPTGLYTAPSAVPNPATVTVTAVLQTDSTKTGSASVTILSLNGIQGPLSLSPVLSSVTTSQTLQLNVLTPGVINTDVNWGVDGIANGNSTVGTISTSGMYTPLAATGSHLITAILQANQNAIGTAQVEVTNFPGTLTWRNDNMRSGVNHQELALALSTVNSGSFGKLFSCALDGYAYAQPLYVSNVSIQGGSHNVVFVATEMDSVYAFDADANPCVQLWHRSLIPSGSQPIATPNFDIPNAPIVPSIGITGTPVIDVSSNTLYVAAATETMGESSTYNERLYALDLATGQPTIQPNGIQFSTPASQGAPFSSKVENQRTGLLLDNGNVFVAFGSYESQDDYHGWLLEYDASTLTQTGAFNVTPSATLGGIWQSGGGPSADANHNVYVVTGDGPFDAYRGGMSLSYGDSFLRFTTAGGLSVSDYFSPCNQAMLEVNGLDVGASAPLLLPDSAGSVAQPHLMLGGSKDGSLYVVNRDNLGEFDAAEATVTNCSDLPRAQTVPVGSAILSTPLFWNNSVYVAAANGNLQSFPMTGGILSLSPSGSQSPETLGPQGATPVISSNGTSNAILWLIDSSGALATPNAPAVLRAFDPNNLSNEIYNSAMVASRDTAGLAVKFTVPTVANAKVYVGSQTELDVYGLLH